MAGLPAPETGSEGLSGVHMGTQPHGRVLHLADEHGAAACGKACSPDPRPIEETAWAIDPAGVKPWCRDCVAALASELGGDS